MRRSILQNLVFFVLFVAFFGAAVKIQHGNLEKVRKNPPFIETWMLSGRSGEMLRVMSLRYDLVAADFLWLRAIQSFGGRGMTDRDWKPVYDMFDTITELDPYFETAYTFGNLVIGDEGGRQREGLSLLNKGMFKLTRQYRIPFEGMYVAHWSMNDTPLARWYGRVASKRADTPDWVPRIAAYIEVKAGAFYIGMDRFLGNLLKGLDVNDSPMQGIAMEKLKEAIHRWNVQNLLRAIDDYTSSTGKAPSRIEDIASQPALQDYEIARMSRLVAGVERRARALGREGIIREYLKDTALPSPAELSRPLPGDSLAKPGQKMESMRNDIFKETLVKQSGIPEHPYGSHYLLNLASLGYKYAGPEESVASEADLVDFLKKILKDVRGAIAERTGELGRTPESLKEVFYVDFNTTEPFGGTWHYDGKTGDFRSSSHPDL